MKNRAGSGWRGPDDLVDKTSRYTRVSHVNCAYLVYYDDEAGCQVKTMAAGKEPSPIQSNNWFQIGKVTWTALYPTAYSFILIITVIRGKEFQV